VDHPDSGIRFAVSHIVIKIVQHRQKRFEPLSPVFIAPLETLPFDPLFIIFKIGGKPLQTLQRNNLLELLGLHVDRFFTFTDTVFHPVYYPPVFTNSHK